MGIKLHLVVALLNIGGHLLHVSYAADIQSMRGNIEKHFSKARHHDTNNQYKLKARKFIFDEFVRFGLQTQYQFFYNERYQGVTFANIIGVLRGERFGQPDDKIVGVAAHYDTVAHTPGVDDNGAGVAAMLEVVRQVTEANKQGTKRKNTIMFISFDAEELYYLGGYAFTSDWIGPYLEATYGHDVAPNLVFHGFIVMDTMMNYNTTEQSQVIPQQYVPLFQQFFPKASANIAKDGFQGDFLLLTFRQPTNDSNLATAFQTAWASAGRPQFEIESFPLPLADPDALNNQAALGNFMRSDHVSLWYHNIPAIFISDSANFRGEMVQCYHHECDNLQNLLSDSNINFLGKTADAIVSTLKTLSETSGPTSNSPGKLGANIYFFLILLSIIFFE